MGLTVWDIAGIAVAGLLSWVLFRQRSTVHRAARSGWRYVPLVSGIGVALVAAMTFGAGILLAPLSLLSTVIARRRAGSRPGVAFWAGATLSVSLTLAFAAAVGIAVYDELIVA